MIFHSQNFLTTNAILFIPVDAIIQNIGTHAFSRKGVDIELPTLNYSYIPTPNSAGVITQLHNSYSSGPALVDDLRRIRVYLVPASAYKGNAVVPYATRSGPTFRITQMHDITLHGHRGDAEKFTPYIEEELSNLESVAASSEGAPGPSDPSPPATGRVISHRNLYRTIV